VSSTTSKRRRFELAPHGIRVNALAPDITTTEGLVRLSADGLSPNMGHTIPMRRPGDVDDIAGAAVFLASDMASYITGQKIHVDGGTQAVCGWYHHPQTGAYKFGPG
jgi:3-oxoacyl-[acyl-carrier protein] reductase